MKAHVMAYLRFKRRCIYCATEMGVYHADVLGYNERKLIEVEVKTSKSDFMADFKKQKHKRRLYGYTPHFFYFAVPESLREVCNTFLKEKYPAYGLLVVKDTSKKGKSTLKSYLPQGTPSVVVARNAKRLHNTEINPLVYREFALRMSSELVACSCGMYA